jgi:hypothetical protein
MESRGHVIRGTPRRQDGTDCHIIMIESNFHQFHGIFDLLPAEKKNRLPAPQTLFFIDTKLAIF